jgi:hypothetical protein
MAALIRCVRANAGRWGPLRAGGPRLLTLAVISGALVAAGCAPSPERMSRTYRTQLAAPVHRDKPPRVRRAEVRRVEVRRVDKALLAPQPAPDCEFKQPSGETADAEVLARLKLAYERHCFQKAELSLRERLRRVQTAIGRCEAGRAGR